MRPGCAIVVALVAFVLSSGVASAAPRGPSNKAKDVAQKVYEQGVDHYRAGRWLEALAAFRASYEMVPSPNSHLMIARTLRDHGELVDSYAEYEKVLAEASAAADGDARYDGAARAARAERSELRGRLTLVTLQLNEPPADVRITIGQRAIERNDWAAPVPVLPGRITVRATASGREDWVQQELAVPGSELVLSIDFSTPPSSVLERRRGSPPERAAVPPMRFPGDSSVDIPRQPDRSPRREPNRTAAWVAFGVGGAGLATFTLFGIINQSRYDDLQRECPGGHCPAGRADEIDRGRQSQVIANIGFGTALLGGTLGFVLLANANADAGAEKAPELARVRKGPSLTGVSVDPHAIEVRGEF
jgi:hypothetical protein